MRLADIKDHFTLSRPETDSNSVTDGRHEGILRSAELVERESTYTADGYRVTLNIKVEVEDEVGDPVYLYLSPTYSWSQRGKMLGILEKLEVLPEPGKSLDLADLVDLPVTIIVENVEKDSRCFSNIVSIKRARPARKSDKQASKRRQAMVEEPDDDEEYKID